MKKADFLYPRYSYHGEVRPKNIVFNANLQEFSTRVNYICGLATNGKLSNQEAYRQIKTTWKQLKHSKKQLGVARSASDKRC